MLNTKFTRLVKGEYIVFTSKWNWVQFNIFPEDSKILRWKNSLKDIENLQPLCQDVESDDELLDVHKEYNLNIMI